MSQPILIALLACVVSAILEGVFAGGDVKARFEKLRMPRFSPPMWIWYLIGVLYYLMCFVVLYRLLGRSGDSIRNSALVVIVVIMVLNALWNWVFFRAKSLFLSFVWMLPYNALAVALVVLLSRIDVLAAVAVVPYTIYLIYANVWTFRLWRMNQA